MFMVDQVNVDGIPSQLHWSLSTIVQIENCVTLVSLDIMEDHSYIHSYYALMESWISSLCSHPSTLPLILPFALSIEY